MTIKPYFDYKHKNLIDLRIKQTRAEFEFNFSILSYENLAKMGSRDRNSAFLVSYYFLKNNDELFNFIQKANSDNIYKLSSNSKDEKVQCFLKKIDALMTLKDDEVMIETNKTMKEIKKLEGAISEIEDMVLENMPSNYLKS